MLLGLPGFVAATAMAEDVVMVLGPVRVESVSVLPAPSAPVFVSGPLLSSLLLPFPFLLLSLLLSLLLLLLPLPPLPPLLLDGSIVRIGSRCSTGTAGVSGENMGIR